MPFQVLALLAVLAAPFIPPASSPPPPDLADFAWLTGEWRADTERGSIVETWGRPEGDALLGMMRITEDGHARLYELFVIERDGDGLALRVRHFDRALVPWEGERDGPMAFTLLRAEDSHAVFEDPTRAFPRRIVYTREGDRLSVRLEPAPESAAGARAFDFERVR
ncbi:MAG: hypothetical protein KJZ54_11925 [Phycisphaerales bacterium]|nr:hypothetical protein [Phycisphaerales bacterium]